MGKNMRLVTITFSFLIVGLVLSCRVNSSIDKYSQIWNTVLLEMDEKSVTIYGAQDSIVLKHWEYKYSQTDTGEVWTPINIQTQNIKIKKAETDSIYKWTKKLTRDFVLPKKFCTDYVGRLKVTIEYAARVKQSCEYSSICEWETMSPETEKLNKMFNEKFGTLK